MLVREPKKIWMTVPLGASPVYSIDSLDYTSLVYRREL